METRTETVTVKKIIAKCSVCGKEGRIGEIEKHELGHTCTHPNGLSILATELSSALAKHVVIEKRKVLMD